MKTRNDFITDVARELARLNDKKAVQNNVVLYENTNALSVRAELFGDVR